MVWGVADALSGAKYSSDWILVWNSFIRLTFFLITVFSVEEAKELDREKNFSRIRSRRGRQRMQFLQIRSMDLLTNPAGSVTNFTRRVFRNALDRPGQLRLDLA